VEGILVLAAFDHSGMPGGGRRTVVAAEFAAKVTGCRISALREDPPEHSGRRGFSMSSGDTQLAGLGKELTEGLWQRQDGDRGVEVLQSGAIRTDGE
jgi:hypothetical protein